MDCSPRLILAFFLSLQSVTVIASEEKLLSRSDPGYAFVERLQKQYCDKRPNPSHNCHFDLAQCRTAVEGLWRELFKEPPSEENLRRSCDRVSTEFELPGAYDMLANYYHHVKSVAPNVGLSVIEDVRFGSLPIRAINARTFPPDPALGNFVFFNIRFFEFASELAKVAALPIPITVSGQELVIDTSKEGLSRRVHENPELSFLFINRILHFLEIEGQKPAPPPADIQPILARYQQGIELFAMAHEYSHIALLHSGANALLEGDDIPAEALGISGPNGDWVQELEADYFAAKVLRAFTQYRLAADDNHMADYMLPLTPQLYFRASELILDARSFLLGELVVLKPSQDEYSLLAAALACVSQPSCGLAKTLRSNGNVPTGHPHPAIRREFVRTVLEKAPENATDDAMQVLSSLMLKNMDFLWDQLTTALRKPEAAPLIESIRKAKPKSK
jgi:hypothetical protein